MTIVDEMWATASQDVTAEETDRRLAVAKVKVAGLWPFLAAAQSTPEYIQRRALVADQITAAAEGDPALASQVTAGLDVDFQTVLAMRPKVEGNGDAALARKLVAVLSPDAERAVRRGLWDAVNHPMPTDPHAGAEATDFVNWYTARHFPNAHSASELPDPHVAWGDFVRERHRHEPGMAGVTGAQARVLRDRLTTVAKRRTANGAPAPAPGGAAPAPANAPADGQAPANGQPQEEDDKPTLTVGAPRSASTTAANIKHIDCDACGATKMPMDMEKSAASLQCMSCGAGVDHLHQTEDIHNHSGPKWASCRKCVAGKTPDLNACGYCDGAGQLDLTTAVIKQADGWDQGLIQITREGAVQYDPNAFGSQRYQKLPATPQPTWIVDQWGPGQNVPLVGGSPNPAVNKANGQELDDTRQWKPQRKPGWPRATATTTTANPYVSTMITTANPYQGENPYLTSGPGHPYDAAPGDAELPGVPQPAGGAQPMEQSDRLPRPEDDPTNRQGHAQALREATTEFERPNTSVVARLAARVIAANPGMDPDTARRVAEATVRRFPALDSKNPSGSVRSSSRYQEAAMTPTVAQTPLPGDPSPGPVDESGTRHDPIVPPWAGNPWCSCGWRQPNPHTGPYLADHLNDVRSRRG